jgi:geranylgeranyl pyrophosphate synthase
MLQSGKDVSALRDMLLNDDPEAHTALAAILQEAGTIENAKTIANRFISEALEQLQGVQDNRYARGLRSIPEHLRGLLKKL